MPVMSYNVFEVLFSTGQPDNLVISTESRYLRRKRFRAWEAVIEWQSRRMAALRLLSEPPGGGVTKDDTAVPRPARGEGSRQCHQEPTSR
jgi:hypothetical protein